MSAAMFDSARALVRAGLAEAGGSPGDAEARFGLLVRIYGRDLDARTLVRIAERRRAPATDAFGG